MGMFFMFLGIMLLTAPLSILWSNLIGNQVMKQVNKVGAAEPPPRVTFTKTTLTLVQAPAALTTQKTHSNVVCVNFRTKKRT